MANPFDDLMNTLQQMGPTTPPGGSPNASQNPSSPPTLSSGQTGQPPRAGGLGSSKPPPAPAAAPLRRPSANLPAIPSDNPPAKPRVNIPNVGPAAKPGASAVPLQKAQPGDLGGPPKAAAPPPVKGAPQPQAGGNNLPWKSGPEVAAPAPRRIRNANEKAPVKKEPKRDLSNYHPSMRHKLGPFEDFMIQMKQLLPGNRPPKVKAEQLSIFTRQFAAMLDAGIPLHRGLSFFAESGERNDLTKTIEKVCQTVSSGTRLSVALRQQPYVFTEVYCSLVETGESSGQLLMVLNRLADIMEKQTSMNKRLIATLTYPLILMLVSGASIFTFVVFILPMIEPIFLDMKVELPWPTKVLLLSRTLLIPAVAAVVAFATAIWVGQPWIRKFLDYQPELRLRLARIPLATPVIGKVLEKIAVSRILFSLASMIDSGMGIVPAIQRSSVVSGNRWITEKMGLAKLEIMEGSLVSEAFHNHKVFPNTAIQIISVGEETSSISDMVRYAAEMYDEEAELALGNMASLLEPLIMGGMGIVVGFIVLAAILPTLSLINNL